MSRIGNNPIKIPEGVQVELLHDEISVKGKLGQLKQNFSEVKIDISEGIISVQNPSKTKSSRAKHGLYRSLIFNMIHGVNNGFIKELELVGVGYRATNQNQILDLALGFSHNILFDVAPEVKVETITEKGKNPIIKLTSHDKQLIGFVAAKIRSFRKPEPYKGKVLGSWVSKLEEKQGNLHNFIENEINKNKT